MYVASKLVTAYQYIAKETFESRLGPYMSQLEEHGYFLYGGAKFYSDGVIDSEGNRFNVNDVEIAPFELFCRQGGWFGPRLKLDISIDKDVLLGILGLIIKHPQAPDTLRATAQKRQEAEQAAKEAEQVANNILMDVFALIGKFCKADGRVSSEELRVVTHFMRNVLHLDDDMQIKAIAAFNRAKDSSQTFKFYANRLRNIYKADRDFLVGIIDLLFEIAVADNELSAKEEFLIVDASLIFGAQGTAYSRYCDAKSKRQTDEKKNRQKEEVHYAKVLGLKGSCTKEDVKKAYRELATQYHPDLAQHLGPKLREVAEAEMKKINEAFEYFQRKYGV